MRRWAIVLLFCAATPVGAQSDRAYVTELGRRVLGASDQVVVAKVVSVRPPFRGISTARLEVAERLRGYDPAKELLLMFVQDYVAPDAFTSTLERATVTFERRGARLRPEEEDPDRLRVERRDGTEPRARDRERSTAPGTRPRRGVGVRFAEGEEGIFFLRRKGASYQLVGFLPKRDVMFERKQRRLKAVFRIESQPLMELRVEQAKAFYLRSLASKDVWERANSAREIRSLARRFPDAFDDADGRVLARALYREPEARILAALEGAVRVVAPDIASAYAEEQEEIARARWAAQLAEEGRRIDALKLPDMRAADVMTVANRYGRAATNLIVRYLDDPAAIVRERAAQALAERGGPSCREPLRRALAAERDTNAAIAMIYACGVKADPDAVPLLVKRLKTPRLERPALHALARIGTPAAADALRAHRRDAPPATVELIDTLLREEFAERS